MRFLRRAPRRSWLFAVLAAVAASAFAVSLSFGSSHREAPSIALDPTADGFAHSCAPACADPTHLAFYTEPVAAPLEIMPARTAHVQVGSAWAWSGFCSFEFCNTLRERVDLSL